MDRDEMQNLLTGAVIQHIGTDGHKWLRIHTQFGAFEVRAVFGPQNEAALSFTHYPIR
jgi:hypothetical protein